jgi:hypothetical protein
MNLLSILGLSQTEVFIFLIGVPGFAAMILFIISLNPKSLKKQRFIRFIAWVLAIYFVAAVGYGFAVGIPK